MGSLGDRVAGPGRVLVTGIGGFTGRYVSAELTTAGYDVIGLTHPGYGTADASLVVDLCDRDTVLGTISSLHLDAVVHLAAISFVKHSDVDAIYRVNIVGTRNLLEALDRLDRKPRLVVLASSANVYGGGFGEPLTEETPPSPSNDYAISKLAMEHVSKLWADRLPITITRPFNYTGIGQAGQFLIPKIIDHYRAGAREIELGNIDVVRDFMDVRDVAWFYRQILERAPAGAIYNLCSGQGHSLDEVLDIVGTFAGYRIDARINPQFVRSGEVRRLIGSCNRIAALVERYAPRPFEETLRWMFAR